MYIRFSHLLSIPLQHLSLLLVNLNSTFLMRDRVSVHIGIKTHTFTSSSAPIIMYLIQINRLRATQRNEETDTNNNLMYHLLLLNTYHYIRKLKIKQQKEGDRTITKVYKVLCYLLFTYQHLSLNTY